MLNTNTNFACLMDLLDIKSVDLCNAVGVDKTLVSRWRSGKRKLTSQSQWSESTAKFFVKIDERRRTHPLIEVLRTYYPTQQLDMPEDRQMMLKQWLEEEGWKEAEYQKDNVGLFGRLMKIIESIAVSEPEPEKELELPMFPENTAVYGINGVQGTVIMCAEFVLRTQTPQEILFICLEGLDMFTRDPKFSNKLMDILVKLFDAGHRMSVVLRTDYKMSDVSLFSGRWLVAHLFGYIKSYYFDDFKPIHHNKMYAVVRDMFVYHVFNDDGKILTTVNFDRETIDADYKQCEEYMEKSKQRFHYHLFEQPDGFLCDVYPQRDRACYLFERLPHFGVTDKDTFQKNFQLSNKEMELLHREFSLLLWDVTQFDNDVSVRYVFCESNIEEVLLKSRHVSRELSSITGRRVNMTTRRLVSQLIHLKMLLKEHKNFEICFMPDEVFRKLSMQIMVYADRVAIGWVAGGRSTACRDYTNVNALYGFCDALWEKIPALLRSRITAKKKLDMWFEKARRYGLFE